MRRMHMTTKLKKEQDNGEEITGIIQLSQSAL